LSWWEMAKGAEECQQQRVGGSFWRFRDFSESKRSMESSFVVIGRSHCKGSSDKTQQASVILENKTEMTRIFYQNS